MWYVKEEGWYYNKLRGPYKSKEEALDNKPKDLINGRPEAKVFYRLVFLENS